MLRFWNQDCSSSLSCTVLGFSTVVADAEGPPLPARMGSRARQWQWAAGQLAGNSHQPTHPSGRSSAANAQQTRRPAACSARRGPLQHAPCRDVNGSGGSAGGRRDRPSAVHGAGVAVRVHVKAWRERGGVLGYQPHSVQHQCCRALVHARASAQGRSERGGAVVG